MDCESHLTGLALSSPARMRGAQQDVSAASLTACVRDTERGQSTKRMKRQSVSVLSLFFFLFASHSLIFLQKRKSVAFEDIVENLRRQSNFLKILIIVILLCFNDGGDKCKA